MCVGGRRGRVLTQKPGSQAGAKALELPQLCKQPHQAPGLFPVWVSSPSCLLLLASLHHFLLRVCLAFSSLCLPLCLCLSVTPISLSLEPTHPSPAPISFSVSPHAVLRDVLWLEH